MKFVSYTSGSKYAIRPTFQRLINVIWTLWINVEITLIRRWIWNKIRGRIFNVAQRWYNVSARRWNNVETTLHNVGTTLIQRCFNLASTLVKAILNPIGLVMIVDREIVEYMLNTWIIFILLNGDIHRRLKCCIQNFKTSLNNIKK